MLDKIVFRQSHVVVVVFYFFFFSMFLRHYFIYVPAGFSKVLLALILGGTIKSHVFEKNMNTISLASFQLEHQLRMQASSRFRLR